MLYLLLTTFYFTRILSELDLDSTNTGTPLLGQTA